MLKNHVFEENLSKCNKLLSFSTNFSFFRPKSTDILRFFGPEQKNVY